MLKKLTSQLKKSVSVGLKGEPAFARPGGKGQKGEPGLTGQSGPVGPPGKKYQRLKWLSLKYALILILFL